MKVEAIQRVQRRLAIKSDKDKEHQFENLMSLIRRPDWIEYAIRKVLANKGSKTAGVDQWNKSSFLDSTGKISQDKIDLAVGLIKDNLKRYKPDPVRRVYIPKSKDSMRPLGIPTIFDRTIQMAVKLVLEPIYESDFLDCSFGFRPKRGTHQVLVPIRNALNNKYHWIIEGDIAKYFDEVNHNLLLSIMKRRIKDQKILRVINSMLKAGIMEDGLFSDSDIGTPQGGVVSPLLANIYLDSFDRWWMEKWGSLTRARRYGRRKKGLGHFKLIRYADDWLLLSNAGKTHVQEIKQEVKDYLWETLKLRLSEEKTKITHCKDGFDFLGWHFVWTRNPMSNKNFLLVLPAKKGQMRLRRKIKELTHRSTTNVDYRLKLQAMNRVIKGWGNYYRFTNASDTFDELNWYIRNRLIIWLRTKTGRGSEYCEKRYRFWSAGRLVWGARGYRNIKPVRLFDLSKLKVISDPRRLPKYIRSTPKVNPYITEFDTYYYNSDSYDRVNNTMDDPWFGQYSSREENWRTKRERTIKHDHGQCVECGSTVGRLEVHHRTKHESGRAKRTLCRECHLEIHARSRNSQNYNRRSVN